MSTFMANKANIERKWYILDAAGKPLGKTAVRAADLLRGKTKVTYTPHADCGDNVIIINAGKAVLTGKKGTQKIYRTHSGWVGGLKETPYRILMQEKPEVAMHYVREGKYQLIIGIGCTGGKHRSVTLANELYKKLKNKGNYGLTIQHRDVKSGI